MLSLVFGMIMALGYADPIHTVGMVLIGAAVVLMGFMFLFVLFTVVFRGIQTRSEKEALRDKQIQDLQKKLEDLERAQKQ